MELSIDALSTPRIFNIDLFLTPIFPINTLEDIL